jgi:hypothetical protein
MDPKTTLSDLEAFAQTCIAAHRYPGDAHFFTPFKCDTCGVVPFKLTIEHHTGSKKGNFRGTITGRCSECGETKRVFSFTGTHREPLREEKPACKCGHTEFVVAECERIERDSSSASARAAVGTRHWSIRTRMYRIATALRAQNPSDGSRNHRFPSVDTVHQGN